MINNKMYINLGYQKDRKGTVSKTNTFNGLLNPVFIILKTLKTNIPSKKIIEKLTTTTVFVANTNVFVTKTTVNVIKMVEKVVKTTVFITTTSILVTNTTVLVKKVIEIFTTTTVFVVNTTVLIVNTIVNLKLFSRHIANLKGYNQYADWFITQW